MKVDLDEIDRDILEYYGSDENCIRCSFYGVVDWPMVKAMMAELRAARDFIGAMREMNSGCRDAINERSLLEGIFSKEYDRGAMAILKGIDRAIREYDGQSK